MIALVLLFIALPAIIIIANHKKKKKKTLEGTNDFTLKFRLSFPVKDKQYVESSDITIVVPGNSNEHAVQNLKTFVYENGNIRIYALPPDKSKYSMPLLPLSENEKK
jgi:hypothetical protein